MTRTLAGLSLLAALTGMAGAGEMKDGVDTRKTDYFLNAAFGRHGFDPMRTLALDRGGVRVRLGKTPKGSTQSGVYSHFTLAGDFELLADYEVYSLPKPNAGYGIGFGLAVHTRGPAGAVFLTRSSHADWGQCVVWTHEKPGESGPTYESNPTPMPAKTGRLGVRRVGTELVLLSANSPKAEPVEIARVPFGPEPVYQVRLFGDNGGADGPLDGRLSNLVVRAESITGAAIPPDTRWSVTTWTLLASLGMLLVFGVTAARRRFGRG